MESDGPPRRRKTQKKPKPVVVRTARVCFVSVHIDHSTLTVVLNGSYNFHRTVVIANSYCNYVVDCRKKLAWLPSALAGTVLQSVVSVRFSSSFSPQTSLSGQ